MSKINALSANLAKWLNTLKQIALNLPINCLNVFDHFVELALKGLTDEILTHFSPIFHSHPSLKQ